MRFRRHALIRRNRVGFRKRVCSHRILTTVTLWLVIAAATVATPLGASAQTSSSSDPDIPQSPDCHPSQTIRILFLLDTSGSLQWNDPAGNRIEGTIRAVSDLVTRAINDGPEQRRRYGGWSLQVAVDTFANDYYRSGDWRPLVGTDEALLTGTDQIRDLARQLEDTIRAAEPSGSRTDYRRALAGAVERFREGGGGSCNLLFWFTDGEHDTQGRARLNSTERRQIDDMCRSDGVVADLRQSGIWTSVIELTENRAPTAVLPRLVGTGQECDGLNGSVVGRVIPVASASQLVDDIERILYEVWPRTPIEYHPCSPTPERRFVLDEDLEEVRVFVDLTKVDEPDAVVLSLQPPGGRPFPISFPDTWRRISNTGLLGWKPTKWHREIRAHQLGRQLYGTVWGADQEWRLFCSGPGYERAEIAIEKLEIEKARVVELNRTADNLVGQVQPPPKEGETVRISARIGGVGPGAGRSLDLPDEDLRVERNGRFTIPTVKDRVEEALGETGECQAELEVSVTKWVTYGEERSFWDIPGSEAVLAVDVCRGPLPEVSIALIDGQPSGPLEVTARGGYLDSLLTIAGIGTDPPVELGPLVWRCEVPANVDGFRCDNLAVDVSDQPDIGTEVDLEVTVEASPQGLDRPETRILPVAGLLVKGKLPHPDRVMVGGAGTGVVQVGADGGLHDSEMEITAVRPVEVSVSDGPWRCYVPANEVEYSCSPDVVLTAPGATRSINTPLSLTIRARSTVDGSAEWVRDFPISSLDIPGDLPRELTVTALPRDPDEPITLKVAVEPGAQAAVVSSESVEPVEAAHPEKDPVRIVVSSWEGWRCDIERTLPGVATNVTECDQPLRIEWEGSHDSEIGLNLTFGIRGSADGEVSQSVTATSGPFEIRVWELSEFIAALIRYLAVLVVAVLAVRVLTAWWRRRWAPASSAQYFTLRGDSGTSIEESTGRSQIEPSEYEMAPGLDSRASSANLGEIQLRMLWWPLLLGGRRRIAAFYPDGACTSGAGSSKQRLGEGRYGVVGSSLRDGWALGRASDDGWTLVVWDLPSDQDEAQARLDEAINEAAARWDSVSPRKTPSPSSAQDSPEVPQREPPGEEGSSDWDSDLDDDPFVTK